jgi:hypothetical protein
MMRLFSFPVLCALLTAVSPARAEFPIGTMGPRTLGIQYGFAFRGQNITAQDVPSHEIIHAFNLGYSPVPYVALEGGLGLDRFSVDRHDAVRFQGEYGLAPLFGLTLATPYLMDFARVAGGVRGLYLNSEDASHYQYSGLISSPWLGFILTPSAFVDIGAGARGHYLAGSMEAPGGSTQSFSNRERVRGFFSVTLKSPSDWAFFTLDADFSPSVDADWSNGPREASVGISCGTLLGTRPKPVDSKTLSPYFPAYPDLKKKQDKMAEEIE